MYMKEEINTFWTGFRWFIAGMLFVSPIFAIPIGLALWTVNGFSTIVLLLLAYGILMASYILGLYIKNEDKKKEDKLLQAIHIDEKV